MADYRNLKMMGSAKKALWEGIWEIFGILGEISPFSSSEC